MTRSLFRLGGLLVLVTAAPSGFSVVEAKLPSPVQGAAADLSTDFPPVFANQPQSQTVSVGDSPIFEAWADAMPEASFQWQMSTDQGLTWANLVEGAAFTGATDFGLRVNAVTMAENGTWFRLVAFNDAGVEFSDPAMLTVVVGSIPTVLQQPANAGVVVGGVIQFVASIQGTPAPGVQWQMSTDGSHWRDLSESAVFGGVTTTTLSVTPVDDSLNGSLVRMTATNSAGTAATVPAILTVSSVAIAPSIVQQPQDGAVPVNSATFSVVAVGAPTPTYQWQRLTTTGWVDLQDTPFSSSEEFVPAYVGSQTPTLTGTVWCCSHGPLGGYIVGTQVRVIATNVAGRAISSTARAVAAPLMSLDRSSLAFGATETSAAFASQTVAQTVRMTQTGSGQLSWTAATNQPWLVVTPTSGSGPVSFSVSIKWVPGLAITQRGTITISFPDDVILPAPGPLPRSLFMNISVSLNVLPATAAFPPFGSFDSPTDGSTGVTGSIPLTGWALDAVQATRVTVCRDPAGIESAPVDANCAGNAKIYVGDAIFVDGARPDVQAAFPATPMNTRAGWGYLMLTNFLPSLGNGTFTFTAYAFDVDGRAATLGSKTITCDNAHATAPFGAIDTPAQGGVVSGTFANGGWVVTQSPKDVPADSSTAMVFIDGAPIGDLDPGRIARADITSLFSSSYDTTHAAGGKIIDSTLFANGVHTIFWSVSDTGGQSGGIGSRFFTISNGGDLAALSSSKAALAAGAVSSTAPALDVPATLDSELAAAPIDLDTVQGRRGYDLDTPLQTFTPSGGRVDVQAEELDRIELHLSRTSNHQYTGYLRTPSGLRPLPVGSSLNPSTGAFTWMPGVGFYGAYDLTFAQRSGDRVTRRQDVRITLNAKGSNRVGPQTIIDAPLANALVGSTFYVGGWAADLDSGVDTGVSTVHVWAYPVDQNGSRLNPVFLGPAAYGGSRPDVAALLGAHFGDSGYGMVVSALPPGTYDIAVFAYSTVKNAFTPAKVVRVTIR
jgi:hypothetical protein